jgi:hypothetical protein
MISLTHATDHTIADVAVAALIAFGGDLRRERAAMVLKMWRYYTDLTPEDVDAVLAHFRSENDR